MIVMRALRFHFGAAPEIIAALSLSLALAFALHLSVEIPWRRRILTWSGDPRAFARPHRGALPAR
jgi:hypothetical protein